MATDSPLITLYFIPVAVRFTSNPFIRRIRPILIRSWRLPRSCLSYGLRSSTTSGNDTSLKSSVPLGLRNRLSISNSKSSMSTKRADSFPLSTCLLFIKIEAGPRSNLFYQLCIQLTIINWRKKINISIDLYTQKPPAPRQIL